MTTEQTLSFKYVSEWVFLDQPSSSSSDSYCVVNDGFGVKKSGRGRGEEEKVMFELHSHSKFGDGFLFLSPVTWKSSQFLPSSSTISGSKLL